MLSCIGNRSSIPAHFKGRPHQLSKFQTPVNTQKWLHSIRSWLLSTHRISQLPSFYQVTCLEQYIWELSTVQTTMFQGFDASSSIQENSSDQV